MAVLTTKYKYNSVRPETYINRLIDAKWKPLIETPPFPEYTSGHSVISAVSANILTHLIPQPYTFVDSSEMQFGIAPRSFKSFSLSLVILSLPKQTTSPSSILLFLKLDKLALKLLISDSFK
jgi:hypothetical protein